MKDAAFQYYIITRCKVKIGRVYIVLHGPNEETSKQSAEGYKHDY